MRDAEHELSQQESAVEITPLPQEKELPEAQQLSPGMVHESARHLGRGNHSGSRRYLLTALALCLMLALFLTIVVVQLHQPAKPSSHASSVVASPTATPSYVPTDYSVNTTIVNGVAYVGAANGELYALRVSDGNVRWRNKIDPGANAAPIVNAGIIFITTSRSDVGPGSLYALRASDGEELWQYTISDAIDNLLVANGIVYMTSYDVVSQNGSLIALRASDGAQLWHKTVRGFSYNAPVVDNQVVYVSTSADNGSGTVYALRANDGTQLWYYTTTTFTSVPLVNRGIAYLVSDQGLSALQASDGQLLWRVPVEGNTNIPPQVINGVLYLTTTKISSRGFCHSHQPGEHAATGGNNWQSAAKRCAAGTCQTGTAAQTGTLLYLCSAHKRWRCALALYHEQGEREQLGKLALHHERNGLCRNVC